MEKRALTILMFVLLTSLTSFSRSSPINKIIAYFKKNYPNASQTSRQFIYNAVDINDDGKDEYLVGLMRDNWCGSGGFTMLILTNAIKLNTKMTLVEHPVYIGAMVDKKLPKAIQIFIFKTETVV